MKYIYLITITLLLLLTSIFVVDAPSYAQEISTGSSFQLSDSEAISGDIIAVDSEGNFVRADTQKIQQIIGVLADTIDILYESVEGIGSPIVSSGDTKINVTTINGDISPGDFIIPSSLPGKGQRATDQGGFIVGVARSSFTTNDGETISVNDQEIQIGTIDITVQIRPIGASQAGALTNLVDQVANLFFTSAQTPEQANILFRYIAAAIIATTAIGVSFRAFGGSISNGIEALGRNPLARRHIQTAILINAGLILLISIGGIVLSLAILQF